MIPASQHPIGLPPSKGANVLGILSNGQGAFRRDLLAARSRLSAGMGLRVTTGLEIPCRTYLRPRSFERLPEANRSQGLMPRVQKWVLAEPRIQGRPSLEGIIRRKSDRASTSFLIARTSSLAQGAVPLRLSQRTTGRLHPYPFICSFNHSPRCKRYPDPHSAVSTAFVAVSQNDALEDLEAEAAALARKIVAAKKARMK